VLAGLLFPFLAAPFIGPEARSLPVIASSVVMGLIIGACLFLFVRFSLKNQLRQQLELLRPLTGAIPHQGETLEDLNHAVQTSVRQVTELVQTLVATIDDLIPHYRSLGTSSSFLAERARDGIAAANSTRQDVTAVEEKQQGIAEQMGTLAERTQDEAALSRELSASLEEMAGAMDHSNAQFLETTTSVEQMASSIRESSSQAEKITHNVEGTAHDLDGIAEAFARIKTGASASAQASAEVKQDAESGLQVVQSSMEEMARIEEESRKATEAMARLSHQTGEVAKIIEVIRELVSDTELLAFNAAIIAAQAGEEGKGFSVVAEEIRDLADRTTTSAQDIQRIVKAIGGDTREVTDAVAATEQRITKGRQLSRSTGEALQKIVASASQAATASGEIARLTGDQERRSKTLLDGAGQSIRSVKAIARAIQEQQIAAERIQQGVIQMKAAADQISRGMEEQVRANREFDKGLANREGQIQAVDEAIRFQMSLSQGIFAHFAASEKRLRNNLERINGLTEEIAAMEVLTGKLRDIAAHFGTSSKPGGR
jgi:methyl-accepting chemotaxis protein